MPIEELRRLTNEDLQKELDESYQELRNVRFRLATRQLGNVHEKTTVQKRIAQIKTLQRQRELGIP